MGCHGNRRGEDLPLTWWCRASVGGALGSWPIALLGHFSGLRPGLSLSLCRGSPSSGHTSSHPSKATQGIFRALKDLLVGSWALAEQPGATEASYTRRGKSAGHSTRALLPAGGLWVLLGPPGAQPCPAGESGSRIFQLSHVLGCPQSGRALKGPPTLLPPSFVRKGMNTASAREEKLGKNRKS